ncbi:hypothetical protein MNBD_GAMMA13-349 [hydrothermal vent metagenome]|uniref:Uncharacterized protein n=1 Tax=hydrothermal vent metagenome TaxID=652676 RepID=A0A3B0YJS1_9ZZZZ
MKSGILVLSGLLFITLQACSPGADEAAPAQKNSEPQHVWKDQVKALEKAKNLEQEMNESFEKRSRDIEKQAR